MMSRLHVHTLLFLVALLWGGMLVVQGVSVTSTWFRPFSTVAGVLVLLLSVFEIWLWRLPLLQGWFVPRPNLRGTWHIELQSDWNDPATGASIGPILGYLVVRQTFSSLSIRLFTAESASELIASEISKASDGTYRVGAVYRNEPKLAARDRSAIHFGALMLDAHGNPVNALNGHYWTDRKTRGELRSLARHPVLASSFGDGQRLLPSVEAHTAKHLEEAC